MEEKTPDFDALARLLAGLPCEDGEDPFLNERDHATWQDHARDMDGLFSRFHAEFASPFRQWSPSHLAGFRKLTTVFYPFSGPDFMFAHLLHPRAGTVILGGLEACEAPHQVQECQAWRNRTYRLKELASGIRQFLEHSFFVTTEMRDAFGGRRWNGILAPLLVFLVRTGHRITGVEAMPLEPSGSAEAGAARAVRILATLKGVSKQVIYLQKHLRDDHCPTNDAFFQFVGGFGRMAVFLKSASYLLHEPDFSHLREFIFRHAACIVQDPSSIPYSRLLDRGWRVQVHGNYQRTPRAFPQYEQPALAEACRDRDVAAHLPFGIGYHSQPARASLMVATPPSTPVQTSLRSTAPLGAVLSVASCGDMEAA